MVPCATMLEDRVRFSVFRNGFCFEPLQSTSSLGHLNQLQLSHHTWTFAPPVSSDCFDSCFSFTAVTPPPVISNLDFLAGFVTFLWRLLLGIWWIFSTILTLVCAFGLALNRWTSPNLKMQHSTWVILVSLVAWNRFVVPGACAMDPMTAADLKRAEYRSSAGIQPTRVARQSTLDARRNLLAEFGKWLLAFHGVQLSALLDAKPVDPEEISGYLVKYGQDMFLAGRAYGKYAETINAVATYRPIVKKQLTIAWDLAFAWLADEPFQHHPALPLSILLALLSVALMWGWPVEAAIIGLTWSGILRIGETMIATRGDLILPQDSAPGVNFALLRIRTPKTRGRAARHQAARIDPPDIVALLSATFASWPEDKKLWGWSAATLRKRFNALLSSVGLPVHTVKGKRPFSLGSLRPGGATFLLLQCEDAEHVRRRGRWVTAKVCEIYLQEVLYTTYTEKLSGQVRAKIEALALAFPQILQVAIKHLKVGVPPNLWYSLFQMQDSQELGAKLGMNGSFHAAFDPKTGPAAEGPME